MKVEPVEIKWHPDLPIFAKESFLKAVGNEYGWLGGFTDQGDLRCVLPYTIIRKATIRLVRFRVEIMPIGAGLGLSEEKEFLNNIINYFKAGNIDMIIPASTNTLFRTYPEGSIAAPYGNFIIDLNKPEEELWNNLNATYRKKIRNSIKNGVKILDSLDYLETSHKIISETLKKSSLKFISYNALLGLIRSFEENVKIFVAVQNEIIQGCTIFPFSNYAAYSLYGGRIQNAEKGAMNLLNWEAIRQFRNMGVKRFDFMGVRIDPAKDSKQEGIHTFKQRFGGQLVKGYMWKYPFHRLKYWIYCTAIRIQRGGDIVDAERGKLDIPDTGHL